jgi:hypothetical protein
MPASLATTLGRADSYPLESYRRGVRVWIRDEERVWTAGELVDDLTFSTPTVQIRLVEQGDVVDYNVFTSPMPFLCNPDILLGKDDLTDLSYLHEPAGGDLSRARPSIGISKFQCSTIYTIASSTRRRSTPTAASCSWPSTPTASAHGSTATT